MRWMVLLLLAASLAGCADADPKQVGSDDSLDGLDASDNAANLPIIRPVLGLSQVMGPAPLQVNMTLSNPGHQDASWELFGYRNGNHSDLMLHAEGLSTPSKLNHVFEEGAYVLLFKVTTSDGRTATIERNVTAFGPAPIAPPAPLQDTASVKSYSGTVVPITNPTEPPPFVEIPFKVRDSVAAISAWLTWAAPGAEPAAPIVSDLDLYLLDPAGNEVAGVATQDFEYLHFDEPLKRGTWKLKVVGYDIRIDTPFDVDVIHWTTSPTQIHALGTFQVGSNAGPEPIGDEARVHHLPIPAGTNTIAARLTWALLDPQGNEVAPCMFPDHLMDVNVEGKRGNYTVASARAGVCEFAFLDATEDLGGVWTFTVTPAMAAEVNYQLTLIFA